MASLAQLHSSANSYFEALAVAERRAVHSFFDQHVVEDDGLGHFALDEGDYNALPAHLANRVVHTVHAACSTNSELRTKRKSRTRFLPFSMLAGRPAEPQSLFEDHRHRWRVYRAVGMANDRIKMVTANAEGAARVEMT